MSEWISVEDRLPQEIIEFVLVGRAGKDGGVAAVMEANYMDGKFISWRFGAGEEFVDPTHWMPLPEPPTGG